MIYEGNFFIDVFRKKRNFHIREF